MSVIDEALEEMKVFLKEKDEAEEALRKCRSKITALREQLDSAIISRNIAEREVENATIRLTSKARALAKKLDSELSKQ